jgi:hypothetical protein
MERTHSFSLTPEWLVETSEPHPYPEPDPEQFDPSRTARYVNADDNDILMYAVLHTSRAHKFVYAQSASALQETVTEIELQGNACQRYVDRFQPEAENA